MGEIMLGIASLLSVVVPIVLLVWLVMTLNQMARDLARVAEGVHYLAERASRQDALEP